MINNVVAKYADVRKGLYDTQYEISGKPPTQNNTTEEPRQAISLIDLDDNESTLSPVPQPNVMNDLSDIFGSSASISPPQQKKQDIFDLLGAPPAPQAQVSHSSPMIASPSLHNTTTPTFTSPQFSPPQPQPQQETVLLVNKNGLRIELQIQHVDTTCKIKAYFSNQSTAPMDKLMLRLAAPKVIKSSCMNSTFILNTVR